MSLSNNATTIAGATTGTAGITFPWWNSTVDALGGAWPLIIQAGGFIVIVLTIRKLILESRLASRRLREMDERPPT
jgi:hypothetical protein